jgi:hypothetical protein
VSAVAESTSETFALRCVVRHAIEILGEYVALIAEVNVGTGFNEI